MISETTTRFTSRNVTILTVAMMALAVQVPALGQGSPDILWAVDGHDDGVLGITFSSDGRQVATAADYWDKSARIWDAADGALLQTLPDNGDGAVSVAFDPNGRMLSVGYKVSGYPPSGLSDVWEIATESVMHTFGGFYSEFSADGSFLASAGPWRDIYLHQMPGGQQFLDIYTGAYILDISLSPTDPIVASANSDNKVKLWSTETGESLRILSGHQDDVSSVDFSPDGMYIASGAGGFDDTHDASIKIWRVSDGELIRTLDGHDEWVYALEYSPDGQVLISHGRDGHSPNFKSTIKLWRVSDGQLLRYYDQGVTGSAVAFSPNGKYFAYGQIDGTVTVAHNPFPPATGDVNLDGGVDIDDIFAILAAWGDCDGCLEDVNEDGMVDIDDVFMALANWG